VLGRLWPTVPALLAWPASHFEPKQFRWGPDSWRRREGFPYKSTKERWGNSKLPKNCPSHRWEEFGEEKSLNAQSMAG
jgi:hypothetical protein